MTRYTLPLLALVFTFGCPDKDDTGVVEDGGAADGGGSDGGGELVTTIDDTTSPSGVSLVITNGDSGGYRFGMVEVDSTSTDPWTAEDCYLGYTTGDGTELDFCHPATDGTNSYTKVAFSVDMDAASETLFSNDFDAVLTYYLEEVASGDCWVWGSDTSYYTALGCMEI